MGLVEAHVDCRGRLPLDLGLQVQTNVLNSRRAGHIALPRDNVVHHDLQLMIAGSRAVVAVRETEREKPGGVRKARCIGDDLGEGGVVAGLRGRVRGEADEKLRQLTVQDVAVSGDLSCFVTVVVLVRPVQVGKNDAATIGAVGVGEGRGDHIGGKGWSGREVVIHWQEDQVAAAGMGGAHHIADVIRREERLVPVEVVYGQCFEGGVLLREDGGVGRPGKIVRAIRHVA